MTSKQELGSSASQRHTRGRCVHSLVAGLIRKEKQVSVINIPGITISSITAETIVGAMSPSLGTKNNRNVNLAEGITGLSIA